MTARIPPLRGVGVTFAVAKKLASPLFAVCNFGDDDGRTKMSAERIIPILVYADIAAGQAFLVKAFGFREGRLDRDAGGNVIHAEVHHGGQTIWLHRVTAASRMSAPLQDSASSGLVVHVGDVDAHYARARAAGATIDSEPRDQEYGQREYGARDPQGHRWWFATPKRAD